MSWTPPHTEAPLPPAAPGAPAGLDDGESDDAGHQQRGRRSDGDPEEAAASGRWSRFDTRSSVIQHAHMRIRPPSVPVRWAIGVILFVVVFAWFTAPNPIDTGSDSDPFVGRWLVNGVDPFGVEYSGSLSITGSGEHYALEWIITGALVSGTAERAGDELHAEWRRAAGDTVIAGTAEYRIDFAGNLLGTIRVPGIPDSGRESGEPAG